jgi:hypothetical protein
MASPDARRHIGLPDIPCYPTLNPDRFT